MIWLTWRQHRSAAFGIAGLLAFLGVVALVNGIPMHHAYESEGVASCYRDPATSSACRTIMASFADRFADLPQGIAGYLHLLPAFAGVLIGAPLLAREYEQGTWQLAWTQAVPRSRWLYTKLALVLAAMIAGSVAFSILVSWWLEPVTANESRFEASTFNFALPVFASYVVFAVALGLAAGAFIRRTVAAMAVTLVAFLAVRLPVELWLRPSYRAPLHTAIADNPGSIPKMISDGAWVGERYLVDPSGRALTPGEEYNLLGNLDQDDADLIIQARQLEWAVPYRPASWYWQYQLIETAIFGGLALILIALVIWRVRRWT